MAQAQEANRDEPCPAETALALIADKWKANIVMTLALGAPSRFLALRRALGNVHHTSLARSLRELESSGIVRRTAFAGRPLHVEYELTDHGRDLVPILLDLGRWHGGEDTRTFARS
jgi:DNA-binding HxlR family transcriptional regulator